VAVVGGLLFSQLVTLYLTPVFYTYMESLQHLFRARLRRRPLVPERRLPTPETELPEESKPVSSM